jgi:hypothetical protein
MSRNNFKPNKKLSVREALNFLKNLYELEMQKPSSAINEKETPAAVKPQTTVKPQVKTVYIEPDITKFFNDITPTNPMAETIKKLINAGAFNTVDLNHELNLPKSIKNGDVVKFIRKEGEIEGIEFRLFNKKDNLTIEYVMELDQD